jgi:hypothetical protein
LDEEPAFLRDLLLAIKILVVMLVGFGTHDIIHRIRSEHLALMLIDVLEGIRGIERQVVVILIHACIGGHPIHNLRERPRLCELASLVDVAISAVLSSNI